MGIIKLHNIRTFSYHGCLEEEAKIGSDYRVDLEIKTDLRKSAVSDDLNDTELLKLISYLETIKDESNYRRIEKRGWSV